MYAHIPEYGAETSTQSLLALTDFGLNVNRDRPSAMTQKDLTQEDTQLKSTLLAMWRECGLDFGIIVRKMTNPYFLKLTRDPYDPSTYYALTGPRPIVGLPLSVFKIFLDGHEEQVREVEFAGMTLQDSKEIAGSSEGVYVYNNITSQRRPSYTGILDPQDIRVSVVTPSLLFESLGLKKTSAPHRTAPIAPQPASGQ